jgi:phage shock protein A
MALLERVSTLIRANLNDLVDRAEDPEKLIKQVILDMENQFLQVKTQVAISIADLHMLEKKKRENEASMAEWLKKAEKSVDKKQDDLARMALERYRSFQLMAESFQEQVSDQQAQVENLKSALQKLEQKLAEAQSKKELLLARHRRSQVAGRAQRAQAAIGDQSKTAVFDRLKHKVLHGEAATHAEAELAGEDIDGKFAAIEKQDEIERMLGEIKQRRGIAN